MSRYPVFGCSSILSGSSALAAQAFGLAVWEKAGRRLGEAREQTGRNQGVDFKFVSVNFGACLQTGSCKLMKHYPPSFTVVGSGLADSARFARRLAPFGVGLDVL